MGSFAERNAARIKEEERQQEEALKRAILTEEVVVDREAIKRKLAPDLWIGFRDILVRKCKEINEIVGKQHYRTDDSVFSKLRITEFNPTRILRLDFNSDTCLIHYDSGSCVGDYLIEVEEKSGMPILLNKEKDEAASLLPLNLELTAEALLENCLAKAASDLR
jgi:predicted glycosyltransferase